jgi:GNAT superfamily N-acetyltransferase
MTIEITQIEGPDDHKFDQAIRIYTSNLAPYLRQPPRVLRGILTKVASGTYGDQKYHMFLAKKDGEPAGMMTCNYFPDVNVGFAGYLVVAKAYRGQGVGTALYRNGCSAINSDARVRTGKQADALVYETDKLNVQDVKEMEEGVKRLNFFKAMGGYIMSGVDYYQPPLHKKDPPTGLYLMVHPFSQSLLSDLKPDWAGAVIRSIFQHVYRIETPLTESETERHLSKIVSSIQPASLRLIEVDVEFPPKTS